MKNAPLPPKSNIGQPPSKTKKIMSSKQSLLGVYPEVMACNVGIVPKFYLGSVFWDKALGGLISNCIWN